MKLTISQKVAEAATLLKSFTTHTELKNWAYTNGMDNRSAFPKFKNALLEIGIDYEQIKTGVQSISAEELEKQITHNLSLYSDAKASAGRYGIVDENGDPVWFGRFFENDNAEEQSAAELCAASKAVWFASKVKEALGSPAIHLTLFVDAQWLTYQSHSGQKGYKLTQDARKYGIKLSVEWVSGKKNPADYYTTCEGYKKWSDNNLKMLANPVNFI